MKAEPKKILLALSCFAPFWFVEKRSLKRSRGAEKEYIYLHFLPYFTLSIINNDNGAGWNDESTRGPQNHQDYAIIM